MYCKKIKRENQRNQRKISVHQRFKKTLSGKCNQRILTKRQLKMNIFDKMADICVENNPFGLEKWLGTGIEE